jgi:hypothetical protein
MSRKTFKNSFLLTSWRSMTKIAGSGAGSISQRHLTKQIMEGQRGDRGGGAKLRHKKGVSGINSLFLPAISSRYSNVELSPRGRRLRAVHSWRRRTEPPVSFTSQTLRTRGWPPLTWNSVPGPRPPHPWTGQSESYLTTFPDAVADPDLRSGAFLIMDPGWKNWDPGIRDTHPQHCYLILTWENSEKAWLCVLFAV